ncbi:MAG: N-acyl homoserine lactonase family protein [Lachnospiraceae bacterium]|nr:N-acyl homoserine lactonase family protein [Lachnospiraceae bacterium]
MQYKIKPILGGEFGMVRDDIRYQGGDPALSSMVPSVLFLLISEKGQILVDTSFGAIEDVTEMGLIARRNHAFLNLLENAGVKPEKVQAVILTHSHWDHAANIGLFPEAAIYCQQKEWEYAFSLEAGYSQKLLEGFRQNQNRFVLVDGNVEPIPGIRLLLSGGHTPGSQMVVVQQESGEAVICGDEAMTFRNLKEQIPIGLCQDVEKNKAALCRAIGFHTYLPSHDEQLFITE